MKLFIPDAYINRITYREPRRNSPMSTIDRSMEAGYSTWQEAKDVLVARGEKEVEEARKRLRLSECRLENAKRLRQKESPHD